MPSVSDSKFLGHGPCEDCGSRDNLAIYDDGHTYCFGCQTRRKGSDGEAASVSSLPKAREAERQGLLSGRFQAIPKRGLSEETCRRFGYMVGDGCHIAPYRDKDGAVVAQKLRYPGKKFTILGDASKMGLFGDHILQRDRHLVITEGEIDAMSVSQAFGNKYAVVSLPNGAQSAVKAIQKAYDYVVGFGTIVIMFDEDEAGRAAAKAVAEILPPGKTKIARLSGYKDANEALVANDTKAILEAFWGAREWRPDGIVAARDLRDRLRERETDSRVTYPWEGLQRITRGLRTSELVTVTAGSGVGKTTFVRQLAWHLHQHLQEPVGMMMLEESNKRTLLGLVGIQLRKNLLADPEAAKAEEIEEAFDDLFHDRPLYLYDHFGSTDVDNVINRIRFLAKACGCKWIILDHISILVSGIATGDERKLIDVAMTKLRTLVQETGIGLVLISHLRRPEGDRGHEDGARVSAGQLRGSHAIVQLSDMVIGLQRPQDGGADTVEVVVLKNRYSGEIGLATTLTYDRDTGLLGECAF